MRPLLLALIVSCPAWAQQSSDDSPLKKEPALTADDVKALEHTVRAGRPPPFLVRKDGTLFGVRPKAPADARLGEWLKYINRTLNPRSR